jgi:hypothetical protein
VRRTDLGDWRIPKTGAKPHHRGVLNWQLQRVARPGEQADNEAWPMYSPRGQVWVTRLGSHTRVVLVADEADAPTRSPISTQRWA